MRRPWQTKEWRDKRAEFIKDKSCEWCESTEKLTIDHRINFYSRFERGKLAYQLMLQYFQDKTHIEEEEEIERRILKTTSIKRYAACPKCGYSMQSRKTMQPKYHCYRCNFNTDKSIPKISISTIRWLNKMFFQEWAATHKEEIDVKFNPIKERTNQDYMDFKDVVILCRRCAFARLKGMYLCPNCKKKYVPNRFDVCFDCLPSERKEEIKSRREEMAELEGEEEMEEEVPLVEVTLPCGSKVMVYSDQWKWGGMVETCMHQCPNAKIGGDVNNCDVFLKWDASIYEEARR
jgi:ribosomal protein L32/predicted Zn-ribbon and HTH transcriptional regulator